MGEKNKLLRIMANKLPKVWEAKNIRKAGKKDVEINILPDLFSKSRCILCYTGSREKLKESVTKNITLNPEVLGNITDRAI